jgi:glyoxylase-like metal-dependent hydrolase (beta-lactamase superfamily II)
MQMQQLNENGWAKTYLIYDEVSAMAAIIDPVYDYVEQYLRTIEGMGLSLEMCIATHTHADHITGCFTIAELTGCDYVMWHSTPSLGVTNYVNETSKLQLGNEQISFYHVPGHTEDSMLVVTTNHVFTGDFLFTGDGGVGRDDLPSGRMRAHFESLNVMAKLDGELLVCSGHEAPGVEFQTLSWNRQNNTTEKLGYVSKIKVALPANLFGEIPDDIPWL